MSGNLERFKVFVTRPDLPVSAMNFLSDLNVEVWEKNENVPRDVFLKKIAGKNGLLINATNIMDAEAFEAAGKSLKAISTLNAGVDHIDMTEARKRGVIVGYLGGAVTDAVADVTIALILIITRNLFQGNAAVLTGKWKMWMEYNWMAGIGMRDMTIGIFGLGKVGTEVAKRLLPFKPSSIIYTSRNVKKSASDLNAVKVPLEELLKNSDVVIVSVSLNLETKNIINAEKLNLMKNTAYLVNISRGAVIDQKALVKVLKEKRIAGAALDVMNPEPLPKNHELLKLDNCFLTPHIANADISTRHIMAKVATKNLEAALTGKPLPCEATSN